MYEFFYVKLIKSLKWKDQNLEALIIFGILAMFRLLLHGGNHQVNFLHFVSLFITYFFLH